MNLNSIIGTVLNILFYDPSFFPLNSQDTGLIDKDQTRWSRQASKPLYFQIVYTQRNIKSQDNYLGITKYK